MFIEDDLLQFLEQNLSSVGKKDRNSELILYHFGFLDAIWPTQDETGKKYVVGTDGRKAQRVFQILEEFKDKINSESLKTLRTCAKILSYHDFIGVQQFSKFLFESNLVQTIDTVNVRGLLNLVHEMGLCNEYEIYRPDLVLVTRQTIFRYSQNFIIKNTILEDLRIGLDIAVSMPSETGLTSFTSLKERIGKNYLFANQLLELIQANSENTWFNFNDEIYFHTPKGKSIINFLKKVFTIREKVEIDHLAMVLNNAFGKRGNKYPSVPVVKKFLEKYDNVHVNRGFVSYQCSPEPLRPIEKDAIKFFETRSEISFSEIRDYLVLQGHQESNVTKFIDNSPLIYVDKSDGWFYHKYSLVGFMENVSSREAVLNPSVILEYVSLTAVETDKVDLKSNHLFSPEDFKRSLEQIRAIGEKGEEFINRYLLYKREQGLISDCFWVAKNNAISPYDFKVIELDKSETYIDVKSTRGRFENVIHISYSELLTMKRVGCYQIYRVYELDDFGMCGAKLQTSENLTKFARNVIDAFKNLPNTIKPDSISLSPKELEFLEEINLNDQYYSI